MLNLFDVLLLRKFGGGSGGGSSVTVEPLTVTSNGTQTAPSGKAYSPVTVNVPNPNTKQTVLGTAANPWGDVSYSELAAALASGDANAIINVQMGNTTTVFPLESYSNAIFCGNAAIGTSVSESSAADFKWRSNGSIDLIAVITGGQVQDYTAYAAAMQTSLTIYWHPMP